jgi:hypothetical protein
MRFKENMKKFVLKNKVPKINKKKNEKVKSHSLYLNILVPTIVFAVIGICVIAYFLHFGVQKVMTENYKNDLERCRTIILDAIDDDKKAYTTSFYYRKIKISLSRIKDKYLYFW